MITVGVRNTITKAIDLLGPNGEFWLKNASSSKDGCMCLRKSLDKAAKELGLNSKPARVQVSYTLGKMNFDPYIPGFNDDPNTTFIKIKQVLEASLEEEE